MSREMVFISYSTKNTDLADALVAHLEKEGIICWYAPRNIEPGCEWVPAIKNALQTTKVFVLLYTPQSNQSRQVMNEVALAFNAGKTMIPYCTTDEKMNDELEYYLTRVHWLNAMDRPQEKCFEEISRLIKSILLRMNIEVHPIEEVVQEAEKPIEASEKVASSVIAPSVSVVSRTEDVPEVMESSLDHFAEQDDEAAVRAIKKMREAQRNKTAAFVDYEEESDVPEERSEDTPKEQTKKQTKKVVLWGGVAVAAFVVLLLLGILFGTKLSHSDEDDPEAESMVRELPEESVETISASGKKTLGLKYLYGDGEEKDVEKGRELLKQAGEEGDYEAKVAYAKDLIYGVSGGEINKTEGVRLLKQIVDGGTMDPNVLIVLADYYEEVKDYKEALRYYILSSDIVTKENICLKVAEYYFEGKGTKKNADAAKDWISRSRGKEFFENGGYENFNQIALDCENNILNVSEVLKNYIMLDAVGEGYSVLKGSLFQWESPEGYQIIIGDDGHFNYFTNTNINYQGVYMIKQKDITLTFENGQAWRGKMSVEGGDCYMDIEIDGNEWRFTCVS